MLVYRGMDVGTAKPTPEQRARVPHHLLDLAEPSAAFSVQRFQALAGRAIDAIQERGAVQLLVGSGGLYWRGVIDGLDFPGTDPRTRAALEAEARALGAGPLHRRLASLDPEAAGRIDPRNARRVIRALEVAAVTGRPFTTFAKDWEAFRPDAARIAGIDLPRDALHRRIERRVAAMMPGLLAEAEALVDRGFSGFLTAFRAIGYAEAVACVQGRSAPAEAADVTIRRTKALARRQLAWLRRDPRIEWFRVGEEGAAGAVDRLVRFFEPATRPESDAALRR